MRKNIVKLLNESYVKLWKEPKYIKPDIHKLTQEMLKDPKYKDKVWKPWTAEQVANHLNNYNNIESNKSNRCLK